MQKKLLAAVLAATIGVGGNAFAADVYSGGLKDVPVYAAPTLWSGLYIGADLGGLIDNNNLNASFYKVDKYGDVYSTSKFTFRNDGNKDEPIGGVHIGYNFQTGSIVYGIEGDVNFADNIGYLATIRGRLGYTMDTWLLYATGGAAFISFDTNSTVTNTWKGTSLSFHDGREETGYVVGFGLEKKVTPNISFGIEGLYYNFDDGKATHVVGKDWCYTDYVGLSKEENFWTIRARMSYHFGAAPYVPLK